MTTQAIAASAVMTNPSDPTDGRRPFVIKWSPAVLFEGDRFYTKLPVSFNSIAEAQAEADRHMRPQ
jgi:hypothetical protein